MTRRVVQIAGVVFCLAVGTVVVLGILWALSEPEDAGFIAGLTAVVALVVALVVAGAGAIVWAVMRTPSSAVDKRPTR